MLSLVVASYTLRDLAWRSCQSAPVDWAWIRRGAGVSLRLFVATMALLGIQFADRYFLQHYHGEAAVGVYTFFGQIANSIQVFVSTAVITVIYPRVVEAWQKGRVSQYSAEMRNLAGAVVTVVLSLVLMAALGIDPVLRLVGKTQFSEQISIFWIMLASSAVLAVSYVPHYALYARNRDRALVGANALGFVTAIVVVAALVPSHGAAGAASGTLAGIGTMAVAKAVMWLRASEPRTTRRSITVRRRSESVLEPERAEVERHDI